MDRTVVLLEADEEELQIASKSLGERYRLIKCTCDEKEAEDVAEKMQPDFFISSLLLKNGDGIEAVKKVKKVAPNAVIIILSAIPNIERLCRVSDFTFDYCMLKPVNYKILSDRMDSIYDLVLCGGNTNDNMYSKAYVENNSDIGKDHFIDEKISRIFIGMGIPPHIKGYGYLREGIKIAVTKPEVINKVTKVLYPTIGEKFDTSASKVERAIRHAIEVAWNKGRVESFNNLLGVHAYSDNEKPTNSEFIALIADRLLLDGIS